jgi:hypothetical protein
VRQHLLAGTGWCHSEQQWRAAAVQRRAQQSWAEAAHSGEQHYRHRLTASAFSGWQLAAESTSTALVAFQDRWQRQRLLQRTLLLWRGLVLLLRHQRQEAASVDAWRAQRLARGVLQAWRDVAAALAVQRAASDAAVQHYERSLLRRKLLQWSLVACASSAARLYYAQVLGQRCVWAWRRASAASAAAELQQELQQQQAAPAGSSAWATGSAADTALAADVAAAAWAGHAAGGAPWQLEQQQQDEVFVSMQQQVEQLAAAQGVAGLVAQPGWLLLPAAAGAPRGAVYERSQRQKPPVTEAACGKGRAGQRPTAATHQGPDAAQTASKKRGVVHHTAAAGKR